MTDNTEPMRHGIHETQHGMAALVAAASRPRARQQTTAVIAATGMAAGTSSAVAHGSAVIMPGTGALNFGELPELLIPAVIVVTGDEVAEGHLIEAVALPWFEIIKELQRDSLFLHQLDWRRIEELIAGAYKRDGWPEVILTPRSGDGGRDVIANKPGLGAIRFYDQVKAYKPGHKVPAEDVRALLGVLTIHPNVSKAVITTTTLFAPGVADEMKALIPYRLELRDGPKLREWLLPK